MAALSMIGKRRFRSSTKSRQDCARDIAAIALLVFLLFVAAKAPQAATLPTGFSETLITGGLTNPTAMEIAPDGRIFVCQQGGQLRVIKNGTLLATPFVSLTVDSAGERGLLGIAFDPNFASNNFVYLYYTLATETEPIAQSRLIQ